MLIVTSYNGHRLRNLGELDMNEKICYKADFDFVKCSRSIAASFSVVIVFVAFKLEP